MLDTTSNHRDTFFSLYLLVNAPKCKFTPRLHHIGLFRGQKSKFSWTIVVYMDHHINIIVRNTVTLQGWIRPCVIHVYIAKDGMSFQEAYHMSVFVYCRLNLRRYVVAFGLPQISKELYTITETSTCNTGSNV